MTEVDLFYCRSHALCGGQCIPTDHEPQSTELMCSIHRKSPPLCVLGL